MNFAKLNVRAIRLACLSALALGGMSITTNVLAAGASADGEATVIAPITITKNNNLAFGRFSAGAGGTVILTAASARSATGGVLLASGITPAAASYAIGGEPLATYAITLPGATDITNTTGAGAETMSIGTWVSSPTVGAGGALAAVTGLQTLLVGGTLTVGAAQVPGAYVGAFTVSVDYN
jgi:hypothetical protein